MSILWMLSEYFDSSTEQVIGPALQALQAHKVGPAFGLKRRFAPAASEGTDPVRYVQGWKASDEKWCQNGQKWWIKWWIKKQMVNLKWWIKKFDCDQSVSWHSMVSLIQNHRSRMVKDGLPGPSNWTLRWPSWDAGPQIGDSKSCQQMLLTSWQVEFLARLTSVHSLLPFGPLFALNGLIMICRYWT